ncbi:hypothetical protein AK812_SmicGene22929 [Symbiodinium microadriaticum]|uniref:Uncharacterized protein n=1 Tax=Symbiodinium microadriaticum TaxID=2951 RepID=A0A1Q9DIJ3_SYMMI|nr:hypothetical protein AK812_SmicGene22929 [Symbiodinium microadriaticum]
MPDGCGVVSLGKSHRTPRAEDVSFKIHAHPLLVEGHASVQKPVPPRRMMLMMLMVMVMMMMMVMPLYLLLLLLLTAVQLDTEAIILITMTVLFIFLVLNIDSVIVMTIFVNITVIVNPSYHLHHRHGFDHVFSSLFSCVGTTYFLSQNFDEGSADEKCGTEDRADPPPSYPRTCTAVAGLYGLLKRKIVEDLFAGSATLCTYLELRTAVGCIRGFTPNAWELMLRGREETVSPVMAFTGDPGSVFGALGTMSAPGRAIVPTWDLEAAWAQSDVLVHFIPCACHVQSTSEWRLHAQAMQAARSGFTSVRLLVSSHEMGSLCRMLSAVCFSVLISCAILGAVREKHGAALAPPRAGPSRPFLVCCVSRKRRAGREAKVLCSMSRQLSGGALKFMLWGGILSL